jgi:hypothetical protein
MMFDMAASQPASAGGRSWKTTMVFSKTAVARRLFMVLSPRSLPYARIGLKSLLSNALEPVDLCLITDSVADQALLLQETASYEFSNTHRCTIFAQGDLDARADEMFGAYPNLRRFRDGHPCWRKITDPLLLSAGDDEIIVLDPDLYFPNKFAFEPTPAQGLLLMWQRPNCLLPSAIVNAAMRQGIPLAHHVDIGVAHWRARVDLEWLEWLLGRLGVENYSNAKFIMHIEAIVWAAIAMHVGGGYLAPAYWHCWRRSQRVRLLRRLHVPGPQLLRHESFSTMKCFHAGGEAKYWLQEAAERGWLNSDKSLDEAGAVLPFSELTPGAYRRDQAIKSSLRRVGYYNLFSSRALQSTTTE